MILITSYNRPEMLLSLLRELKGKDHIVVVDDGSDYDPSEHLKYADYYRFSHKGKAGYWLQYQYAFEIAQESNHNFFLFLQDDLREVEYDRIKKACYTLKGQYAFNITHRGGRRGWTDVIWYSLVVDKLTCKACGYIDCQWATNRSTLEALNFKVNHVDSKWAAAVGKSSGVGRQLSKRFAARNIPMILPMKSLAFHGDHNSLMHPEERKVNPLVSKYV